MCYKKEVKVPMKYRILILACILFQIGNLNAVPADYEAVYTVKLLQADGTLRAKLENNDGTWLALWLLINISYSIIKKILKISQAITQDF